MFASLLQGDIRRRGVPELETFEDDRETAVLVELARLPKPVCGDSYIMVEWSRDLPKSEILLLDEGYLRSNMRTDPSAPQDAKTCSLPATKATSKTSLSCAIKCVLACKVFKSHTVHVVSILAVTIKFGASLFQ
jgi:hypothetical protein